MITIYANKLFPLTTIVKEAKTVSGAWNKIREIREELATLDDKGEGTLIRIEMGDTPVSAKLPLKIVLLPNKNGKIEFTDVQKIREKAVKCVAEAEENTKEEELINLSIQVAEELNED